MSREDQKGERVFLLLKGDSMEGLCILWWALTTFQNEKIKLIIVFIVPPNGNPLPALTQSIDRTLERLRKCAKKSAKYKPETMMSNCDTFENGVLDLISQHQIKKLAVTSVFSEKLALANASCKIWFVWYGKLVFIRDASPSITRDIPSTSGRLITKTPSRKWYQGKQHSSRELEKIILQQENEDLRHEIDTLRHEKSQLEIILAATMSRLDSLQSNYDTKTADKASDQKDYSQLQQNEQLKNENDGLKTENNTKIQDLNGRKTSFEVMLEIAMNCFDSLESNYSKMQEDRDIAIKEIEELKHELERRKSDAKELTNSRKQIGLHPL